MADPANLIRRYAGDDWTIAPIALTAGPSPLDLTGARVSAEVYAAYQATAVLVLVEGAGLTVGADRTKGVVSDLWVPKAVTAGIKPLGPADTTYSTRIDVVVTDSLGRSRVWLVVPVLVLDRRSDLPT